MSNLGKHVLNWKREFPIIRVALGLLGREGYTSVLAAKFLLAHDELEPVKNRCLELGRKLNFETIQSRLKRPNELAWIEEHSPLSYKRGEALHRNLREYLKKEGVSPFGNLG